MISNEIFCEEVEATCPGSRFHEKKHGVVNPDGTIDLVSDGFEDIQEVIESWEPETDIYNIISRVQNGDITLLNQRKGFYADVTSMPKSYAEMLQVMIDARSEFEKLPKDIREKFNNDFNQYLVAADNAEEFYKKLGIDLGKDEELLKAAETDKEEKKE